DFGLARVQRRAAQDADRAVGGTPAYADPRLSAGARPGPEHDQFAFGITALELLTGRHPFAGRIPVARRNDDAHQAEPGVPSAFLTVLRRCAGDESTQLDTMDAATAALVHAEGSRRRRNYALGATGSFIFIGVAAWSLKGEADPCPPISSSVVVSTADLERVAAAFSQGDDPARPQWLARTGRATSEQLAGHAQAIADARQRVCVAQRVDSRISDGAAESKRRC